MIIIIGIKNNLRKARARIPRPWMEDMRKLIFLQGPSNCGKTTTLKMLIAMLLDLKQPYTVSVFYSKDKTKINAIKDAWLTGLPMPDGDVSVVLDISGVLVGIRTTGDTIGSVWDNVAFFEKHQCYIGVLACHEEHLLRSGSCLTHKWESEVIKKERVSDSSLIDQNNKDIAEALFDKVMNAVKQKNAKNY